MKKFDDSIKPASAVYDNGRRGNPLPGCDCAQCFGYCLIDSDKALREKLTTKGESDEHRIVE